MSEREAPERRLAAVVVPIFANPPHDVVFVERAVHLRRHAGQIAFPGGAIDEADEGDLSRAALRELHEEIGIPPGAVTVVGTLPAIPQRQNVFIVTPFVGVVQAGVELVVDLNEASAAHRVPLAAILEPGAVHAGVHVENGHRIETYQFDHGGLYVWGLTGIMLHEFVTAYRRDGSPLRAALETQLRGR